MSVRLAALVVNYNTGAFAERCVQSLRADWERDGRAPEDLEVVVIDNASPVDQTPWMDALAAQGNTVIRCADNLGYAGGVNRCFARTHGGPDDVVALLNPDLCFPPGSVGAMMDYLAEHPECGALDPSATIDTGQVLNLPRNLLPTILEHARLIAANLSPALARAYSRRRLALNRPWWESTGALPSDMLSGCCVFMRRSTIERLGGEPMDDVFPLYYEDTDLFRRLTRLGFEVVHLGGARVLHHWSRSSGVGVQFDQGEPGRRLAISQRIYYRRYYTVAGDLVTRWMNRLAGLWPRSRWGRPMHPMVSLGSFTDPVELPMARPARFLVELALTPTWLIAVGIYGEGDRWVCPEGTWAWFFHATYYMRAIDLDDGTLIGAWTFDKVVAGRAEPPELHELDGLQGRR